MLQQSLRLNNAAEHRHVDENGYITVDTSPVLKAGVLEYYGSELIDGSEDEDDVIDGVKIDPDKVYKVYVSPEELDKGKNSFKLLPLVDGHQWLGAEGADAKK